MLTREENRWNFTYLKICSNWNFLPISVDEKSGRISRQSKRRKLYIWYFLYSLELSHAFYGFIRFIQLVLSPNVNRMMDQVFIHGFIFPIILATFWSYQLLVKRPGETCMLFNQLFSHQENNNGMFLDFFLVFNPKFIRNTWNL